MTATASQIGALAIVATVFIVAMVKDWETPAFVFGFVLLLGSCQILGVK